MNAKLVEQLARLEPRNTTDLAEEADAFCQIYLNPEFGWHITKAFARARLPLPVTMIGRDHWLFTAHLMHLNATGRSDPSVLEAYHLFQQPGTSAKLKAMLITGLGKPIDDHLKLVAKKMGIPKRTVEAFEILFFNILDRHRDGLYLSSIVYLDGRQVEFAEDYLEITPIADLLLRAAYNSRDIDLVLRLSGMTDAACRKELVSMHGSKAELEARIMGNALLMAKLGMLGQRSVGLQRATTLLAAGRPRPNKADKTSEQQPPDIALELATVLAGMPLITEADRQEMQAASRPGQSYCSDDTGKISPIDPSDTASYASQSGDTSGNMEWFSEPVSATWHNQDSDKPVVVVALMSKPGFPDHYLTAENVGIPVSEVFFEN